MPFYHQLNVSLESGNFASPVFSRSDSPDPFSERNLGKNSSASDRERQAHFELQLRVIRNAAGRRRIPVWLEAEIDGEHRKFRMDRGCIGHSRASGFLVDAIDDENGCIEFVTLRD
jgi:hypothetical protein